jgi:hypothetical protein
MSGQHRAYHNRHLADREHAVYVIWCDDECLYVGMTSNWLRRTSNHMHYLAEGATHIDAWHVGPSRAYAEAVERVTIRDLNPRDNRLHSPRLEEAS